MDIYDEGSFESMIGTELEDNIIKHYGTPRHSGRYPWGSGENPYQHEDGWLAQYRDLKAKGLAEKDIAKEMGVSTTVLRNVRRAKQEEELIARATYVKKQLAHGYTPTTLSRLTGWNESTIRGLRDYVVKEKESRVRGTADMLIREYKKKGWLDVGKGVDKEIGVTEPTLKAALQLLKEEGYSTVNIEVEQINNPGQHTTVQVLTKAGTTQKDVFKNLDKINTVAAYSENHGQTYGTIKKPAALERKRIMVRYGEEGGAEKDGTIEIRPGVNDLILGKNHYAQVRINVDDKMYMKGMAFYGDPKDFPPGVDIIYNSNKSAGTPDYDGVFKKMKATRQGDINWDNPFGAVIKRQIDYTDEDGNKKLSPINIIKQEGDWDSYSKNLSSQFLSKQKVDFVKKQLNLTFAEKMDEYRDISNIPNPAIRAKFLVDFAESCDSDSVELKATAVPGQSSKVILPVTSLKDNEVYAPTYKNGQVLCLVRYPHGGVFEIPTLVVNNKNQEGRRMMGNSTDAIGINTKVAGVLSGADFDGDSVVVIPQSDKVKTLTKKPYKELEGWSEKMAQLYAGYEGMPKMTDRDKGMQMGMASNLITDMTIQGAPDEKIIRAVKFSMVVIDAQKHGYNWKLAEKDLGINALRKEYQSKSRSGHGASTLISQASGEARVPQRSMAYGIDPKTGAKIYRETGKTYFKPVIDKKTGELKGFKEIAYETKTTKMAEAKDAHELSSGTMVEEAYANYANALKSLANQARKDSVTINVPLVDPALKKEYNEEIQSIKAKIDTAEANAPKERIAQVRSNAIIRQKFQDMPELKEKEYAKDLKKLKQIVLSDERAKVGASKKLVFVHLTEKEKKAIDNGAISATDLRRLMRNMDKDELREYVMPRYEEKVPVEKITYMKSLSNMDWTIAEIAERVGLTPKQVSYYINDGGEKD